jgi:deazaflavin-dependent oxidoreductase (nitroreductase family)
MASPNLETVYYEALNSVLRPLAESGALAPGIVPAGLIVLETTGRRSGLARSTPVVAAALGDCLIVSTVRGRRSHWVKNLIAQPDVRYWRGEESCAVRAYVAAPISVGATATNDLPAAVELMWPALVSLADVSGIAFVVLAERSWRRLVSADQSVVSDPDRNGDALS